MPKEIIPTCRLSDNEFVRRILQTDGAKWARKHPEAAEVLMSPLWEAIAEWEDLRLWGLILEEGDLATCELYNMMLHRLKCKSYGKKFNGEDAASNIDYPTGFILANAAGNGPARWKDRAGGGRLDNESSRNEDRMEREAEERQADEEHLLPILQDRINQYQKELDERDERIRRLRQRVDEETIGGDYEGKPAKKPGKRPRAIKPAPESDLGSVD